MIYPFKHYSVTYPFTKDIIQWLTCVIRTLFVYLPIQPGDAACIAPMIFHLHPSCISEPDALNLHRFGGMFFFFFSSSNICPLKYVKLRLIANFYYWLSTLSVIVHFQRSLVNYILIKTSLPPGHNVEELRAFFCTWLKFAYSFKPLWFGASCVNEYKGRWGSYLAHRSCIVSVSY